MKTFIFKKSKKSFKNYEEREKMKIKNKSNIIMANRKKYAKIRKRKKNENDYLYISLNILLILVIFETITIIILSIISKRETKINNNNIKNDDNLINEKYTSKYHKNFSKEEAIKNAKKYLRTCRHELLINNKTFSKSNNPIISVVIPAYNCEKTIKGTIRSIQNQDMLDLEIIVVNDLSNDTTLKILEEYKLQDQRIKIINNEKNYGTLYSRCVGVLEAKGKYILTIDNDDMFSENDVFDILYEQTEEEKFDIISFRGFEVYYNKIFRESFLTIKHFKVNNTVYQPDLGIYPKNNNHPLYYNNIYIWAKLVKSGVYKAAVNILGKQRYSNYIVWAEDTSMFFLICNIAQSYKYIKKFGIAHFMHSKTSSSFLSKKHIMFTEVFLIDIIFDFSKNEYKDSAVHRLNDVKYLGRLDFSNEKTNQYFKSVIKKIMNCDYINEKHKNELKNKYTKYDVF